MSETIPTSRKRFGLSDDDSVHSVTGLWSLEMYNITAILYYYLCGKLYMAHGPSALSQDPGFCCCFLRRQTPRSTSADLLGNFVWLPLLCTAMGGRHLFLWDDKTGFANTLEYSHEWPGVLGFQIEKCSYVSCHGMGVFKASPLMLCLYYSKSQVLLNLVASNSSRWA